MEETVTKRFKNVLWVTLKTQETALVIVSSVTVTFGRKDDHSPRDDFLAAMFHRNPERGDHSYWSPNMYVPQHPVLNRAMKVLLQKIVAQVPIAGPILSDIVGIIWPAPSSTDPTSEELFDQIKEHVAALINETVAQNQQSQSTTVSMSATQANVHFAHIELPAGYEWEVCDSTVGPACNWTNVGSPVASLEIVEHSAIVTLQTCKLANPSCNATANGMVMGSEYHTTA